MTYSEYAAWYNEVSPKVALRLAICNLVAWQDIIAWNKLLEGK